MLSKRKLPPKARQRRQHPNNRKVKSRGFSPQANITLGMPGNYNEAAIKSLFHTRKTGDRGVVESVLISRDSYPPTGNGEKPVVAAAGWDISLLFGDD